MFLQFTCEPLSVTLVSHVLKTKQTFIRIEINFSIQLTHQCSHLLFLLAKTLGEIVDEISALCSALNSTVSLHALHHLQLELTALVVMLSVDSDLSQVCEGRTEEW